MKQKTAQCNTDVFLRNMVLNHELVEEEQGDRPCPRCPLVEYPHQRRPATADVFMDAKEIAKRLKIRKEYVYRLVRQGRLRPICVGRYLRFSKDSLAKFTNQKRM